MDRLEKVPAVARRVVQTAETPSAAKVYQLDDTSGHQHYIVSLQVTMNDPFLMEIGHACQDLMGVQSQDSLRQGTKPEGSEEYDVYCEDISNQYL